MCVKMAEKQTVCCVCLSVSEEKGEHLIDLNTQMTANLTIKQMLQSCVPELIVDIISDPYICVSCQNETCVVYAFRKKCINTQNKIKQYVLEATDRTERVKLTNIISTRQDKMDFSYLNPIEGPEVVLKDECDDDCKDHHLRICSNLLVKNEPIIIDDDDDVSNNESNSSIKDVDRQTLLNRICPICNKLFSRNEHVHRHMLTHTGVKPYQCTVCSKHFSRNEHLQRHMYTHTGEKPYPCELCNRRFNRSEHLRRHVSVHAKNAFLDNELAIVKSFACDICDKRFNRSDNLKKHRQIHFKEKDGINNDVAIVTYRSSGDA